MTSVITRSPLQYLPMNRATQASTNNAHTTRRRSARHPEDREDADGPPPAKRMKGDGAESAHVPGKVNGATTTRKTKKTYEEADDGFAFSRGKSKRAKPAVQQTASSNGSSKTATETTSDAATRKRPRRTLPVSPADDEAPKPRRSKRLSGDAEERTSGLDDPFTSRRPAATSQLQRTAALRDGSLSLNAGAGELRVQKKRGTKIDLILSETPVIRRNKAMRQTSSDSNRRSSAGLRGHRASSLIDSGSSSAIPHSEVKVEDFYKHIGQDLMEPRRMKQLLVWCGHRALGERPKDGTGDWERQVWNAARVVQEELLADFASKSDLSNWFDRQDDSATRSVTLVKKPNPRNEHNTAKLAELEADLARLQAEKKSWDELLSSLAPDAVPSRSQEVSLDPSTIDASSLSPSQAEILQTLLRPLPPPTSAALPTSNGQSDLSTSSQAAPAHPPETRTTSTTQDVKTRLDAAAHDLEFKVDLYRDSLHRIERYVDTAGRAADQVLAGAAKRLDERGAERTERAARDAGVDKVVGGRNALKALGRALNRD